MEPDVTQFVQSELAKSSNLNPKSVYENRVKNKFIPLENPARSSREKKQRDAKRKRKAEEKQRRRLGIIGRKDAAVKGVWKMAKEQTKCVFIPIVSARYLTTFHQGMTCLFPYITYG